MASETDIVNVALRRVGAERIVSLTDGSEQANIANDIYDEARDNLLRSHPWNFATKRVKLAKSTTEPVFEFDNAFPLPSDWLRTISVHDNDSGHGAFTYKMELVGTQRSIVTSADNVWLRYVAKVTDPNLMSVDFRNVLQLILARDFSIPLASSNTLHEKMDILARRALSKAASIDALGSVPDSRPRGSWAGSRGGSGGHYD